MLAGLLEGTIKLVPSQVYLDDACEEFGFEFRGAWAGDDEDFLHPVVQVLVDEQLVAVFARNKVVTLYNPEWSPTAARHIKFVLHELFGYDCIWREGATEVWMFPRKPVELAPPPEEDDEVE